jgi:hypothetical protein
MTKKKNGVNMKYDDKLKCNVIKRKNFLRKKRKPMKKITAVVRNVIRDIHHLRDVELTSRS